MTDKSKTPIPQPVQDKMQQGVRQRYAMGTTASVAKPSKDKTR